MALPKSSKKKPKPTYILEEEQGIVKNNNKRFREPSAMDIISIDDILKMPITLSKEQEELIKLVDKSIITTIEGGPGAGKTWISLYIALTKLAKGEVKRIVISKPLKQSASDETGFLKGTLDEKVAPFIESYMDILETFFTKQQIADLIKGEFIKVVQIAFLRGRTFNDSIVILDEGQNVEISGLYLTSTRIGSGSKLIISFDRNQSDLKSSERKIIDFIYILKKIPEATVFEFPANHNYRNQFIIKLTELYNEYMESNGNEKKLLKN